MNYIGYIYKITNKINQKSYIGKTINLKRRWNEHRWGKGNTAILNKAIRKYGIDNFDFSVIEERSFETVEALNSILSQMEIDYICKFDTYKTGYNATLGGDGTLGHSVSEEAKQKFSIITKERLKKEEERYKCGNGMRGKHHTEDTIVKIKEALLNRDPSIYERSAEKLRGVKRDHDMIMRGAIKRQKAVLQFDFNGNFIKEYSGLKNTGFPNSANICACCKGRLKSAYGYIWRYKKDMEVAV